MTFSPDAFSTLLGASCQSPTPASYDDAPPGVPYYSPAAHEERKEAMDPPRSTLHSAGPSRSPSPMSMSHLPVQILSNRPTITATSTPQQSLATEIVVGGNLAIVRNPQGTTESRQSHSQLDHRGSRSQLSTALPDPPAGLATSLTSTFLSSNFQSPSEGLTRARSRSVGSLETRSQGEFISASSLDTTGSPSGIHRPRRGKGRTHRPGGFAVQDATGVDSGQLGTSTRAVPLSPAARIHDSPVVNQGFQIPFWNIYYWIPGHEKEILGKIFPWQTLVLGISTFLVILALLLALSNLGWLDFERYGSQSRGGIRLVAASAAFSACVFWLRHRLVSQLLLQLRSREKNMERELSTPTTLRLRIAQEKAESSSRALVTSDLPAGLFTPNHPPLVCKPGKPHSQPDCISFAHSSEAFYASQTAATNNSEGRQVLGYRAEASGAPPLPYPSPSFSGLSQSEFRFLSTEPSFRGWVSEPRGNPDGCGAYSDVWKCRIRFCEPSNLHLTDVAVKVLRKVDLNQFGDAETYQRILARFQQEGITWSGLAHPNIVPLIGYILVPGPGFISPWYRRGSLRRYLGDDSNVDRLKLLRGIANALDFLHSRTPQIAHGDIKPENVLIDEQNEPRIADFGLSTILGEEHMYTLSHQQAGTWRWMAPEQILGASRSCESDIYSFGSLAFWVMTSDLPFASLRNNEIIIAVNDHTKPVSPVQDWNKYPELERSLKDIIQRCWSLVPEERISMSVVEGRLAARG